MSWEVLGGWENLPRSQNTEAWVPKEGKLSRWRQLWWTLATCPIHTQQQDGQESTRWREATPCIELEVSNFWGSRKKLFQHLSHLYFFLFFWVCDAFDYFFEYMFSNNFTSLYFLKKLCLGVGKVTQWVKVLAHRPGDLSSMTRPDIKAQVTHISNPGSLTLRQEVGQENHSAACRPACLKSTMQGRKIWESCLNKVEGEN